MYRLTPVDAYDLRLVKRIGVLSVTKDEDLNGAYLEVSKITATPGGVTATAKIFKAVGCPSCAQSGYSGRTVAHELLIVDDEVRSLIVKNADAGTIIWTPFDGTILLDHVGSDILQTSSVHTPVALTSAFALINRSSPV